ncbi:cupin domain-containing protein [Paenibacillus sp. SYP-B3998]|uniref:Cupin domain-containing protein n=1 Tax=Paenibacillus sp. SYP-B3998 TaxID=2678564 RepID=A0A6G3ZUM4_9BACL|nr:cupin domain-containing protein [Paenibacillus sp. SYP-B3998]NEW05117.1 cupin domain-containing protein [Paenibacillus sp. SYP-B3998]
MSNIGVWEAAEPGVKRCILKAEVGLMMMEVHFEPGAEGYQHSHVHEQMSYCLKGKIEFTIDGVTTTIEQGQTIYIPSGAKHGVTALEASALLDVFTPIREDLVKR